MERRGLLKGLVGLFFTPSSIVPYSITRTGTAAISSVTTLMPAALSPMSISIDPEIIRRAVNNAMITNGIKLPTDIYNEEYTKDYLELKENSILEQQYEYRN
jgi:hypothetical protein